jgi:hypothetical protein
MTVYIAGDDSYTATILNVTGKGNNWKRSEIYVIPTIGIACSNPFHNHRCKNQANYVRCKRPKVECHKLQK